MSQDPTPFNPDGSANAPGGDDPQGPLPAPQAAETEAPASDAMADDSRRRAALDALTRLGQRLGL